MAVTRIISAVWNNGRTAIAAVMFVAVWLVVYWMLDVPSISILSLRPKRTAALKTLRVVSMCPSNFDRRRLGNQLFNWAAMLYVANLTGARPAMVRRHPYGWIDRWFDVADVQRVEVLSEVCPCATVTEQHPLTFDPSIVNRTRRSPASDAKALLICGLFQSWRYAAVIGNELRHRLRWKPNIILAVRQFLDHIRPSAWNGSFLRVGVHVRAGDILTSFNLLYGFTVPGSSYFIKAANYLTADLTSPVQFIVATDNPVWTKKNIALDAVFRNRSSVSVVYSEGNSAGFDMALLASCDALILSTGSYGWWSAWLANKTTIYYRYWPRPGSAISSMFTRDDYYPPHWIGIGNQSDHTTDIYLRNK